MDNREVRFYDLRIDNDKKQKEIAQTLKVTTEVYAKWERRVNDIPIIQTNNLANYYNVSLDYLLGMSNNKKHDGRKNINLDLMRKRIKELRENQNKSQEELGEKIGFSQRLYAHYEKGTRTPKTFKLYFIALYFNVSMDYLTGKSDDKKINN